MSPGTCPLTRLMDPTLINAQTGQVPPGSAVLEFHEAGIHLAVHEHLARLAPCAPGIASARTKRSRSRHYHGELLRKIAVAVRRVRKDLHRYRIGQRRIVQCVLRRCIDKRAGGRWRRARRVGPAESNRRNRNNDFESLSAFAGDPRRVLLNHRAAAGLREAVARDPCKREVARNGRRARAVGVPLNLQIARRVGPRVAAARLQIVLCRLIQREGSEIVVGQKFRAHVEVSRVRAGLRNALGNGEKENRCAVRVVRGHTVEDATHYIRNGNASVPISPSRFGT
jgi:hypothetical protein